MADDLTPDPRGTFVPGGVLVRSAPSPVSRTVASVTVSKSATALVAPVSAPLAAPVSGLMGPMGPMGPAGPRGLEGPAGPAGGIILPAYTVSNVTTDRVLDADSTSIDEVVDVLGTLIADIQSGVGTGGGAGDLDVFTATVDGLVPASGGGTANYLRADGTWTAPAGTGEGGGGSIPAYALTNVTTDRIMDADLVTIDEMADVLGTLITDIAAGGVGGGGGSGGSTQALAETRAAAISSTIDVAVKSLRTAGYALPGDGGHGLYKRLAAAPTLTTNPGYFRSIDRFKADGTTDTTHGGYWALVLEGDEFRIEQFSGMGAYVNSGNRGTDNYQPLLDAILYSRTHENITFSGFWLRAAIRFSARKYWFSAGFDISTQIHFRGPAEGMDALGQHVPCQLIFPTGTNCFVFNGHGTGPGQTGTSGSTDNAGGSSLDGLGIMQEAIGVQGAAPTAHGVHIRTVVHIRNCVFDKIAGDGIHINAGAGTGGGNANRFLIKDTIVKEAWGHGLFVQGTDANAGNIINLYVKDAGKCGICELSGLGNYYSHGEIDGYGNGGVNHLGQNYVQIVLNPTVGVAPGSNPTHWYHIGAGAPSATFVAWNSGTTYTADDLKLPIYAEGDSNTSSFYGVYSEFGAAPSHLGTSQWFVGGNVASTLKTQQFGSGTRGMQSTRGLSGHRNFASHQPGYALHGGYISAQLGTMTSSGGTDFDTNMDLLLFEREIDARTFIRYSSANNIECYWGTGSSVAIWGWTGLATTSSIGTRQFFTKDLALSNPSNPTEFRKIGLRNALPTAAGVYNLGDRFFGPSGVNWRCSAAGGIADQTWATGVIDGGIIVKTTAGRYYRHAFWEATTTEPTHTSGTVGTWTYLTSTDAAFTPVQDIVKQTSAWTVSNPSVDRAVDVGADDLAATRAALGTLIADLKAAGVIS